MGRSKTIGPEPNMSIGEWMEFYEDSSMSLREMQDELNRLVAEGEGRSLRARALQRLLHRMEKEFRAEYEE